MKSATGPLLFLGACRIHEHWGLTIENPPVAGALREQPKGQDPPRKVGTGANAVVRHRLFGAIPLRDGYATHPRRVRDGCATEPRRLRACTLRGPADKLNNIQSKATPSPRGNPPASALGGRGSLGSGSRRGKVRRWRPPISPSGCRGRSPRRGCSGVPLYPKDIGGWARWDNHVRRHKPPPLSRCSRTG